jgi:hypothetical protein
MFGLLNVCLWPKVEVWSDDERAPGQKEHLRGLSPAVARFAIPQDQ